MKDIKVKRKWNGLILFCAILMTMLALTGCGGKNNSTGKVATLNGILSGNDASIWYASSTVDKDVIPDVYVLYGDGTYIKDAEYSYGELSKMTDEEIIAWAESKLEENCVSMYCRIHKEELQEVYDSDAVYGAMGEDVALMLPYIEWEEGMTNEEQEKKIEEAIEQQNEAFKQRVEGLRQEIGEIIEENGWKLRYGISLYTDSSGNYVLKEVIQFNNPDDKKVTLEGKVFNSETKSYDVLSCKGFEIYEATYCGFRNDVGINYFLQRTNNKDSVFGLDVIGTEGILVDEDVQFE